MSFCAGAAATFSLLSTFKSPFLSEDFRVSEKEAETSDSKDFRSSTEIKNLAVLLVFSCCVCRAGGCANSSWFGAH